MPLWIPLFYLLKCCAILGSLSERFFLCCSKRKSGNPSKSLQNSPKPNSGDTYVYIKNKISCKILGVGGNDKEVVEEHLPSESVGEFL